MLCGRISNGQGLRDLLTYIDSSGQVKPVTTLFDWQIRRVQILDSIQAILGKLPKDPDMPPYDTHADKLPPFNTKVKDSLVARFYTRYSIEFTIAEGESVTAYLYIPHDPPYRKRYPAILALHPTGVDGKKIVDDAGPLRNRGYAKELAERGYIVIAPDYPGYGDQRGYNFTTDRYESGHIKAVFDNIRCIDFLQERNDVDPDRIGVIGHSLGGYNSLYTAAFDPRVKVVVCSSGFTLSHYYNNWNREKYKETGSRFWSYSRPSSSPLGVSKYNMDPDIFPFDKDELLAAIAPRPLFVNAPFFDNNFNVEGVRLVIANVSRVYHFLNADDLIEVHYPFTEHNFPTLVRYKAYDFLDKYLKKLSYD